MSNEVRVDFDTALRLVKRNTARALGDLEDGKCPSLIHGSVKRAFGRMAGYVCRNKDNLEGFFDVVTQTEDDLISLLREANANILFIDAVDGAFTYLKNDLTADPEIVDNRGNC